MSAYRVEDEVVLLQKKLENEEYERDVEVTGLKTKINGLKNELAVYKNAKSGKNTEIVKVLKDILIIPLAIWMVVGPCYLEYCYKSSNFIITMTAITLALPVIVGYIAYLCIRYPAKNRQN